MVSKVRFTHNHEDKVCCITGKPTENSISYNEVGFMSSSTTVWVCKDEIKREWIGDTLFCVIGGEMFWEINCDYGMHGVVQSVRNKKHFDYLVERKKNEFIEEVSFGDEID